MFEYHMEKKYKEAYTNLQPALAPLINEQWNARTGFTMNEITPILENTFLEIYHEAYQMKRRFLLQKGNCMSNKPFHLTIEYYMISTTNPIKIPDCIELDGNKYNRILNYDDQCIELSKLCLEEKKENELSEMYFSQAVINHKVIWIGNEERDMDMSELKTIRGWESKYIPLEARKWNLELPLEEVIIQYIEARENRQLCKNMMDISQKIKK